MSPIDWASELLLTFLKARIYIISLAKKEKLYFNCQRVGYKNNREFKTSHSQITERTHGRKGIRKVPSKVVFCKIPAQYNQKQLSNRQLKA